MAGEDLRLPVERQVVGVLRHQHLRQHRLGGDAAGQRPFRCRRLHHRALAAAATVARAPDHLDPVLCRHDVEHLRHVLADHMQRSAAARAALVVDIDDHLVARQMRRQRTAIAPRRLTFPRCLRCRRCWRLRGRERLLDLFEPELQLIRIERLRAPPVLRPQQLPDHQPQLVDLGSGRIALRLDGVPLGTQAVALPPQPLDSARLAFQQYRHRRQPSLQLDRILWGYASTEQHVVFIPGSPVIR